MIGYKTLRENVVDEIRMKIVRMELLPGTKIIEQNLAQEFGISRGPIREALRQLEQEGLVEYIRNAGCSVREIGIKDIYETYLLRSSLEKIAVETYQGKFDKEDLKKMKDILEEMKEIKEGDYETLTNLDIRFHRIIVEKANMSRMMQYWETLNYANAIASRGDKDNRYKIFERQYTIHRELYEECESCDTGRIVAALEKHYMKPVLDLMQQ